MSAPCNVIVAIHGILTRTTDPSWPDRLRAHVFREGYDAHVIPSQYFAFGVPVLEVGALNWWRARQILGDIEPFLDSYPPRLHIVAHSNGGDIAIRVARNLWSRGHSVDTLVLTCAAAESDVGKNGVYPAWCADKIDRAVAWCGRQDTLIASPWIWPYGHLGAEGWRTGAHSFEISYDYGNRRINTEWYDGGHCHLFAPENRNASFERILAWCKCEKDARKVCGGASRGGEGAFGSVANPAASPASESLIRSDLDITASIL